MARFWHRFIIVGLILAASLPITAQAADCSQSLQSLVDNAADGATVMVPACTYHESVFVGHSVTLDGQNVATVDGDNTRDRWFWINALNVTLKNFRMQNADTPVQVGAIATAANISGVVIDHNDLGPTFNGSPIAIGGTTDSRVTNNQIHGGGQLGIETYLNTRLTISGNHIYGNSTAGVDPNFGAGGIKAVSETGSQIMGNEVDHNTGPAIWCDIACNGVTIAGNNVHDQAYNPVFYEISTGGDIHDNTISASNTNPFPSGNWGCIVVSSSGNTNVHDNACVDTLPLRAQLDDRSDKPADAGHNVVLQNNRLVRPTPNQATSWWQYTASGPLVVGQNGNVDLNNQVVASLTPTPVPTVIAKPTAVPKVKCQVEIWLNDVSQGRKNC